MEKSAKIRLMLISRYAVLSNESLEKNIRKFEGFSIDELTVKQSNRRVLAIIMIAFAVIALMIQLLILYTTGIVNFGLAANILLVIIFQSNLLKELEKKEILKVLKELQ